MQRERLGTGTGHPSFFVQAMIHTEHVGIGVRERQNAKQRRAYHFKPKRRYPLSDRSACLCSTAACFFR